MSDEISRRKLLALPKVRPAFSLTEFYSKRAPADPTLPTFAVRASAMKVETTDVGVTRASAPPWKLRRDPLPKSLPILGAPVFVVRSACLAWQGTSCSTCIERCPVAGVITLDAGRPTVDANRCTGCGECVAGCPAPTNALKLVEHLRSS